ncbi:MAG TPA: DUF4886 domain-containing protein [Flavipsychrobacter sp.]|nr:DUF4886 domain-containing protein [Flavipsychrobacter sp.]
MLLWIGHPGVAMPKRVLFIGNSYTYVNDLPLMLKNVAASAGDTVIYDSYAPGGYTLQQHAADATALNKIMQGNWDFVVLQEQSQRPSFPITQVQTSVFPYAEKLDSLVRKFNPCAETVFYMTWGYKTGDASNCANFPPLCTYQGMDSLIRLRYRMMADSNDAIIAPVGAVRKHIRTHYPGIELYDTDGSHPSPAGTYAAACSFYSILFRKDPLQITFNSTLPGTDAAHIRMAAKLVAFDSLGSWHVGEYDPQAKFSYSQTGNTFLFANQSAHAVQYAWNFGDGGTSVLEHPSHTYTNAGTYTVRLIVSSCGRTDTAFHTVTTTTTSVAAASHFSTRIYPNPVKEMMIVDAPAVFVSVSTADGRLVNVLHGVKEGKLVVDFSTLESGVYLLRLKMQDGYVMEKVIKE